MRHGQLAPIDSSDAKNKLDETRLSQPSRLSTLPSVFGKRQKSIDNSSLGSTDNKKSKNLQAIKRQSSFLDTYFLKPQR